MKPDQTTPTKKAYHPPVIQVYGDIRVITQNLGMTGMNDPGSGSATKTSLP